MIPRPLRLAAVSALVPLTLLSFTRAGASVQEPLPRPLGHPIALDLILDKPNRLSPESGPPGTTVVLEIHDLPAVTPLWLGIGAPRLGFEALALVLTSAAGELRHEVNVPAWAGRDRSTRFIVFDAYFRPLSLTRPFHVTSLDGSILRQGHIGAKVGACPTLIDEDGVAYTIGDEFATLTEKQEVIVEGVLLASSTCGGFAALDVARVYPRRRTP